MASCQNSNLFKLSCMSSSPARMQKIQSNMKELEWSQHFSHYKSMGIFPDANSAVHSPFWHNFELVRDVMVVLIACKNEEDPIKMKALECSQQCTSIFQTLVVSSRKSNSSKLSCMSSLPARMKVIESKM